MYSKSLFKRNWAKNKIFKNGKNIFVQYLKKTEYVLIIHLFTVPKFKESWLKNQKWFDVRTKITLPFKFPKILAKKTTKKNTILLHLRLAIGNSVLPEQMSAQKEYFKPSNILEYMLHEFKIYIISFSMLRKWWCFEGSHLLSKLLACLGGQYVQILLWWYKYCI